MLLLKDHMLVFYYTNDLHGKFDGMKFKQLLGLKEESEVAGFYVISHIRMMFFFD